MTSPLESDVKFELDFTLAIAEIVDSPRSLCVALLVKYHEWDQLLSLECRPSDYKDVGNFADDYLVTSLLQKSAVLPTGIDTKAVAQSAFYEAELHNLATNERFSMVSAVDHPDWWWRYQKYLRRLLGNLTTRDLERIVDSARHGPGSVVGLVGENVPSAKYDMISTVTEELKPFAESIMGDSWWDYHSLGPRLRTARGNKFFTVPKNAKTDRGCAKGPSVNVFLQLGIGEHIVRRLSYFGVDLKDQRVNQFLASMAWDWNLCTIDLRQASDLTAVVPTEQALSDRWCHLLGLARERYTEIEDHRGNRTLIALQKYCAMGNGFTFALQSAIFISVVRAFVPYELHWATSVFGDDIVCPRQYAPEVIAALEYLGFKVNHNKTCLAGAFYESCGTDWFQGQNVRPFFLRREPGSKIPYEVQAANALRLWSHRRAALAGVNGCDDRFKSLWERLRLATPGTWRKPVPLTLGDSGIIASLCETTLPNWTAKPVPLIGRAGLFSGVDVTGWEGVAVKHVILAPKFRDRRTYGVLLSALSRTTSAPGGLPCKGEATASYGREPVRGLFGAAVTKWAIVPDWPDGIDWTSCMSP